MWFLLLGSIGGSSNTKDSVNAVFIPTVDHEGFDTTQLTRSGQPRCSFPQRGPRYKRRANNIILFNSKDILISGKHFLFEEWFNKGIRTIMYLLDINGNLLSFEEFKSKYPLKKKQLSLLLSSSQCHLQPFTSKSKEYETLFQTSRELTF